MQTDRPLSPTHTAIVRAVLQKAQRVCPGSVSLIGIYGSIATGDVHAHSDLDLLLVTQDDRAQALASAFVLDGIGYDLYCTPWARLEQESACPNVHISRWMDAVILWQASKTDLTRLQALREQAAAILQQRSEAQTSHAARQAFAPAYPAYARLMYQHDLSLCRVYSAQLLYAAEAAVCICNRTYYRLGVSRIYQELTALPHQPPSLQAQLDAVALAADLPTLRAAATALMHTMDTFLTPPLATQPQAETPLLQKGLRGTWEEMVSNWQGKLILAAETGNAHLALLSIAACHDMMQQVCTPLGLTPPNVMAVYDPADLAATAAQFDDALQQFAALYPLARMSPAIYPNVDAFLQAYLQ